MIFPNLCLQNLSYSDMQYRCDSILYIFRSSALAAMFRFSLKQSLYSISRPSRSASMFLTQILQNYKCAFIHTSTYIRIIGKLTQKQYPQNIIIKSMPKQFGTSPPTPGPNTHQELEAAIQSLYVSAKIIYFNFESVFQILGLMVLAFLAYKLGKLSVSEPIAHKVKAIEKSIRSIEQEKEGLPARIKAISSFYFKLIVLTVLLAGAAGALIHTQYVHVDILYIAPLLVLSIVLYIAKIIHVSRLTAKSKKFNQKQREIGKRVKQISEKFGHKVQSSLKNSLCKDKIISKQNVSSHVCQKKQCQQVRDAMRAKYEVIKNLAECALQFEWCSTCKSRKPFDELVKFESKPMPAVRDGDTSEEQDADNKISYLMEILDEVDKWVQEAGPCNCSKLYMQEIIANRRSANRQLKEINSKIEAYEKQRQALNASVMRTDSKMSNASSASRGSTQSYGDHSSKVRVIGNKKQ